MDKKWSLAKVQGLSGRDLLEFMIDRGLLKAPAQCPGCGKASMRLEAKRDSVWRFRCFRKTISNTDKDPFEAFLSLSSA